MNLPCKSFTYGNDINIIKRDIFQNVVNKYDKLFNYLFFRNNSQADY